VQRTAGSVFGHGAPGTNVPLNIDIQFNFPVIHFSRAWGGAFLRYSPTSNVVLAHRGIVTGNHGHVTKGDLFREVSATVREAETRKGIRKFFLLGELESTSLITEIDEFSKEVRRAVTVIATRRAKNDGDEHRMPPKRNTFISIGFETRSRTVALRIRCRLYRGAKRRVEDLN